MADVKIRRAHALGLGRARELAQRWTAQARADYGMDCSYGQGDASDTVSFSRAGVSGTLTVSADVFELQARLGFLLSGFKDRIEAEIEKNLDKLLQSPPAGAGPNGV